jgi:hypothetical protein
MIYSPSLSDLKDPALDELSSKVRPKTLAKLIEVVLTPPCFLRFHLLSLVLAVLLR